MNLKPNYTESKLKNLPPLMLSLKFLGKPFTMLKTELMPTLPLLKLLMLKSPVKKNSEILPKPTEIKLKLILILKPPDGQLMLQLMKTLSLN